MRILADTTQNPLVPAGAELVIGTICFVLVFGILARILMPRVIRTLAERTEMIEGGLARSEEAQAEAKELLDQYRQQLAEARHEAARLREEAREQGAQIIAEMREQAQAEAHRITESAQAQIQAEDGDDGRQRGPQSVFEHHRPLGQALGPGRADEVLTHGLQHGSPGQPDRKSVV